MGYDIVYEGTISVDKELDQETVDLLKGLSKTRRVAYDVDKLIADGLGTKESLGIQGEFFVKGSYNSYGKEFKEYVVEVNIPPYTQPGLWCNWTVSEDKKALQWTRDEKSYAGHEWIKYIVKKILEPRGYVANGIVNWDCQATGKHHTLVDNNRVIKSRGFSSKQKPADFSAWYKELQEEYEESHKKWIESVKLEQVEYLHYTEYSNVHSFNVYLKEENIIAQVRVKGEEEIEESKVLYDLNTEDDETRDTPISEKNKVKKLFEIIQNFQQNSPNWKEQPKFEW